MNSITIIKKILLASALILIAVSCKDDDNPLTPENNSSLLVKFVNDTSSVKTITSLIVQPMGDAKDYSATPAGDWSADIFDANEKLTPGSSKTFTLNIPNQHWSRYRVAIEQDDGSELWLHEQDGVDIGNPSITHWGGDTRTVIISIAYFEQEDYYYIGSWSDFVGIENP